MRAEILHHLSRLYPEREAELDGLVIRVLDAFGLDDTPASDAAVATSALPGAEEVVLISYGDTFLSDRGPHLSALAAFWRDHLASTFSTLHVLPFFPSSSDGGFSVVDYRQVDDELGDWSDLTAITSEHLMVDLVCNHGSAQSEWFDDFVADRQPGRDYYLTADPDDDLGMVTRPRTHALLLPVETGAGTRHVWATFSHDQVDFDFSNPDVLVEFCSILGEYLKHGASRVRLDAIAYLWKQVGTTCVHLPQTHQVVKLMRSLVQARDPKALIITETNVPHAENVSYFGQGDEAHVVYNFTLAPLLVWSVITGRADVISKWLATVSSPPPGCTFLNFIASHDGIGLRPVEDLITVAELAPLLDAAAAVGGEHSDYAAADGPRAYELNVSLADLLAGSDGSSAERFVLAHTVMLALQGIPAFYVHSMLATPADHATRKLTGHKRDVNRARLRLADARAQIGSGWRAEVFSSLSDRIAVRAAHAAFAPESPQRVHALHPTVVAVERGTGAERVLALHNVSSVPVTLQIPAPFGTRDLLTDDSVDHELTLAPYQARWLR